MKDGLFLPDASRFALIDVIIDPLTELIAARAKTTFPEATYPVCQLSSTSI
jgi:hypothetical protein